MKNTLKSLGLAAVILLASCSKDDNAPGDEQDQAIEELEETQLEANTVADNVIIVGGTQNNGTPPTPNNAITLDVSSSSNTALLGEGFEVSLDSDAAITGAYLIFKSNDGTAADSYFDIDLAANNSGKKAIKSIFSNKKRNNLFAKEDEQTLDVDFNANIEPGTFCYEICVYDADGNISAPQEVCVTVESWGGNSDIVGKWNFVKDEETYEGETSTTLVGEEDCSEPSDFFCDSQETLTASYVCYTTGDAFITFNADGTFEFASNDSQKELDLEASAASCEPVYENFEDTSSGSGQWAYNSDDQAFILVIYEIRYSYRGEVEEYSFEAGDGEFFVETDGLRIDGDFLIYEEEDIVDNYSYKVYYERD